MKLFSVIPQALGKRDSPTWVGVTLSGLTQGSVLFAGAGGVISQDNDKIFWDATNFRLGIGTASPTSPLHVIHTGGNVRAFDVDARDSSITSSPVFGIRLPTGGANAFQMHRGNDVWAWCSFEWSADNDDTAGKPGFAMGDGTGARDTNLFRNGLNILKTEDAFVVGNMTTTQRNALTAENGMIIYNTTTNAFNFRENGAWVAK